MSASATQGGRNKPEISSGCYDRWWTVGVRY